jgi:hypothetical protein
MDERLEVLLRRRTPFGPLQPDQLWRMPNPQPRREVPPENLVSRTSRLVLLPRDASVRPLLRESEVFLGAYELPVSARLPFGVPGVSGTRLATTPRSSAPRDRRERLLRAEPHIPDWLPLGFHPTPAFERKASILRNRKGRSIRLSEDNHVQIFGSDDRINIYPDTYPERCVCRIFVYTQDVADGPWIYRKRGTGFMAGSRILMTSGHMRPPEPYAGWMIKVVPGSYDDVSVYGPNFYTFAEYHVWYQSDTGDDLMACRLYDNLGDTTGYFGAISYDDDWEGMAVWTMCGYPYDIGAMRPSYQGAISAIDDDDGDDITLPNGAGADTTQIETLAADARGASGSPLYSWFTDGNMYAIGVHHGRETDGEFLGSNTHSVASGGDGFVALVKWARDNWDKEDLGTIQMG